MRKTTAVLAAACLLVPAAFAQAPALKPETQVKLRQAAYDLMNYALGGLDAMVEGKRPYDKDEAARLADLLAENAQFPRRFFGEGTGEGKTRAKPEIWTHRADFDAKMDEMVRQAAKMPAAARTGNLADLKSQVNALGDACDQCHDNYRVKR
ncbi:MAG TPA: cytochrome c [Usitatibacter sp.]|nr:cytochrome c [Usitatibacter sp.]